MVTSLMLDCDWSDERRRQALFAGSLFAWSATPSMLRMVALARRLLEDAFAPYHPVTAQYDMSVEEFASTLARVKPEFIHHPECKTLIPGILTDVGANPAEMYFDVPRLRSATADAFLTTGIAYAFHPHRDTWYSAPQAQLNWWFPVYEIEPDNGLAMYPEVFAASLPNSSETYNYYRWNLESRAVAATLTREDHRVQPRLEGDPELGSELRVVTPVGGILAFSAQQLHATVPNATRGTRFSIDFRTVHIADLAASVGAPRSDAACTGTTLRDFRRGCDLAPLPPHLVERYDDSSAAQYADGLVYKAP
jgi:hypothetical protein